MDSKTVSTQAILDGIDYLKINFIAKLDEQTSQAIDSYTSLSQQGILSSATIDGIVAEIKQKIDKLQYDYNAVADDIRKSLSVTEETISQSSKNISDTLGNGR